MDAALDNTVIVDNNLDEALQELDILFSTLPTELLGDVTYGTNFYQFLWECTPSPSEVKKYVEDKISSCTFYASSMDHTINVNTIQSDIEEWAYDVEITLSAPKDGVVQKRSRVYMFR